MIKAYKYRIYPTSTQKVLLAKTFGCVRFFWNKQVEVFNSYSKELNPTPTYKTSTQFRHEYEWMQEVSAGAIQQKENDFKEFKNQKFSQTRKTKIGNPKFKKKNGTQSYRLPIRKFRVKDNKIRLEKIGMIKMVVDRIIPETSKMISVTISMNSCNQYFVSISVNEEIIKLKNTNKTVGIDVGLTNFATQSDGIVIPNNRYYINNKDRLAKIQKANKRKVIGSSRYKKSRLKVARIYNKLSNQRNWFLHNESTRIVRDYDTICVEDLNVSGLIKNSKVSKSIQDASWNLFFEMLRYKSNWYGKRFIKVPRYYPSSKTCCNCGHEKHTIDLSERTFNCSNCGLVIDRDLNASININAIGVDVAKRA